MQSESLECSLRAIEKFFESIPKPYDEYVREKEMYAEEKGEKRGKKLGKEQRNIEIAKNMLELTLPLDIIEKATSLSRQEIEKLQNK